MADQDLLDAYRRRQEEYEAAVANAPEREKPGFWRKLGAVAAGAVGGWNYDRGGMQWGQQVADDIIEGPYKKRYDEYLKGLEAKRKGLDLAQEGVNAQARLNEVRLRREEMDRQHKAEIDNKNNKGIDIWGRSIEKQFGDSAIQVVDRDDAEARFGDAIKAGNLKIVESKTRDASGRPGYYVVPTEKASNEKLQGEGTTYIENYNAMAKQLGLPTASKVPSDPKLRQDTLRELRQLYQNKMSTDAQTASTNRTLAMIAAAGRRQDDRQDFSKDQTRAGASRKIWDSAKYSTGQIDKEFEGRIAKALEDGKKDEAERLVRSRELRKMQVLNTAHAQDAQVQGKLTAPRYELDEGNKMVAEELPVADILKGTEPVARSPRPSRQEEEDRLFKKAMEMAGGDTQKAIALLKAGKVQ